MPTPSPTPSPTLFVDRDLFIRGRRGARYVRLTAATQKRALAGAGALVALVGAGLVWAGAERAEAEAAARALAAREARIAAMARAAAGSEARAAALAADLAARQAHLETLVEEHLIADEADGEPKVATDAAGKAGGTAPAKPRPLAALPRGNGAATLAALEEIAVRQEASAARLLALASARTAAVERALRQVGLDPDRAIRAAAARGGPLTPYAGQMGRARPLGPALKALGDELDRLQAARRALAALPTARPADTAAISSGFGYRADPFTGGGAMHAGIDFPGPVGTPIRAAAPGRVVRAGVMAGYGKLIEVDHGQGMTTRYAHLSAIGVAPGATVAAGDAIGRMGSTGRSTGSHLHFEVRMNGQAVNPRRFLDAGRVVEALR